MAPQPELAAGRSSARQAAAAVLLSLAGVLALDSLLFRTPLYPSILDARDIRAPAPICIDGAGGVVEAVPIPQEHGDAPSLGFRFGDVAYSPDVGGIPEASVALLEGLNVWIVDALRPASHPSHFGVKQTLEWIGRLGVKRAILTHMTVELDYETLRRQLPSHVEPAYDGMVLEA